MSEEEIMEPSEAELADTDLLEIDDELVTDLADDEQQLLGFRLSALDE